MKFSHSLQFNAVPEWLSKYIAYTTLKKLIYELQRDQLRLLRVSPQQLPHQHPSLGSQQPYTDLEQQDAGAPDFSVLRTEDLTPLLVFIAALDAELRKIDAFYIKKSAEIFAAISELDSSVRNFEDQVNQASETLPSHRTRLRSDAELEASPAEFDDDEDEAIHLSGDGSGQGPDQWPAMEPTASTKSKVGKHKAKPLNLPPQFILLSENRIVLRKRIINLFTTVLELKLYVELNYTGFKKATKKFDKLLNTSIQGSYLAKLPTDSTVFSPLTMPEIESHITSLVEAYALICNHQDLDASRLELLVHLREHVVWERNTVWRDMIGLERKTQGANILGRRAGYTTGDDGDDFKAAGLGGTSDAPRGSSLNVSLRNPTFIKLMVVSITSGTLLVWLPFLDQAQVSCFALLVGVSLLWASEAIPLFVTSLLIPLLIVVLHVLKHPDGSHMDSLELSRFILLTMYNSVILLLLGGFTLAAALSKFHIAKALSTSILSRAGTNPPTVLLTVMAIAWFALMWVSNVAAPVLCFSLIQPLLRTLPRTSNFSNALILGIALASNIGGMALPIASPQNIIAIGAMNPAPLWGQWFVIATPVCILLLLMIWGFLVATFRCNRHNTQLVAIRTVDDKFSYTQWFIIAVLIGTILLWCVALRLQGVFGEMGIIALIPMVLFFGLGLLTTEDFNNYPWNIVVLAMGGTALGKAVASSGLLATISIAIKHEVQDFLLFGVTLAFGLLILTMATFVSHTVAALIIIPLIAEIGETMPEPHPRLLIMASALLCSAAMGLPTLGFPNVTAICMVDDLGKPYLTVSTFITRGVPSSVFAYVVIVTVGYVIMRMINF